MSFVYSVPLLKWISIVSITVCVCLSVYVCVCMCRSVRV